jgi:hypothetical protein
MYREPVSIRKTQRSKVVTYKTQPNTVNHLLVLFHGLQECTEQCITVDAVNVSHLLEDKHSSFQGVFLKLFGEVLSLQQPPMLSVTVKVLFASWVIAVDRLSPFEAVRWCKVWRSWWPDSTPDNAITEVLPER